MSQLPGAKTAIRRTPEERLALSMQIAVQLADVRELVGSESTAPPEALEKLLSGLIKELGTLSDTLTRTYFSHAPQARRL